MTEQKSVVVIGHNGKTGRRLSQLLDRADIPCQGVSRSTQPVFDWHVPERWEQVLRGHQQAYVVYQPDLAVPAAAQAIAAFIEQAKISGLEHIVLLSGRGEEGAQYAEQLLMQSGLSWNVVRASWFAQNFSEGFMLDGVLSGQVALPAGETKEPFIDIDDIAEVAFNCLTRPELANQLFEVTGPELLTLADCVRIIAETTNRKIEFLPLSTGQFLESMQDMGADKDTLWLMNELFDKVMDGRNSYVCDGVETVLGRPATSFSDYARKTALTGVWALPQVSVGG